MNTRTPPMPAQNQPPAQPVGRIIAVEADSAAAQIGVQPGDGLLAVNGQPVEDVIDVQYHAAEDWLELDLLRGEARIILRGPRQENQPLGLEFAHPTFDIDIRRCNNLCPFCFVLQMGPRMRRTLYIKDDDYRYSFLFGHYVTLTNLSDHDWQRILTQRLSPLYVSVHATDIKARKACLGNDDIPDVLAQIRELGAHHITVHAQLVITPELNDGPIMAQSVADLAALWPMVESVSIVPVGLTKHHKYHRRTHTRAEAEAILDWCHARQEEFLEQIGVRFVYPTDEWYLVTERLVPPLDAYDDLDGLQENGLGMVRYFLDEWATVRRSEVPVLETDIKRLTLVTAALFAPTLARAAAELQADSGVQVDVIPIRNEKLGETITVAGLLMAEDILNQLKEVELGEVVVLPRIMFDHPDGISLDDISPQQIAQTLGRPVALADLMGDLIDVLTGQNPLTFDPDGGLIHPDSIMRVGGWAVEKYL
jgi:putative radical SAM enzyme (TIGR03279 family)